MVTICRSIKEKMKNDLKGARALSRSALLLRIGLIGAAAGFLSWVAILIASMLWEVGRPSGISLMLAIPRGALFGMLLALIFHWYWKRHPDADD